MKILKNIRGLFFLRATSGLAVFGCLFFGSLQLTYGQTTTTFAQVLQRGGAQNFTFTNSTSSAAFNTPVNGALVYFYFYDDVITGLDPQLVGQQPARLYLTAGTTAIATLSGSNLLQPFNDTNGKIEIIRDTTATVGSGTRRNLLTIQFSSNTNTPALTGNDGGSTATFQASTPVHIVTFSSDFLNFSNTNARNFALSFSSVNPTLAVGNGGLLRDFTAAGSGTFASNPIPTVPPIVTAARVSVSGRVLTSAGRGLRNAQVKVTQADGSTRTVLTNLYGHYSFADLTIPQTVIVSVISKSYIFNPQIITLDSDFSEMNFTPNESKY